MATVGEEKAVLESMTNGSLDKELLLAMKLMVLTHYIQSWNLRVLSNLFQVPSSTGSNATVSLRKTSSSPKS